MRLLTRVFASLSLCIVLGGGALAGQTGNPALSQVGVIDALLAGAYQGFVSLKDLAAMGDIGIGTFDDLDGELVLLDGTVYQVPHDGKVRRASSGGVTPFAQVARMPSPSRVQLPAGADLKTIEALLDAALGDANVFAVARVDAVFAGVKTRSVPRQAKPYRPLSEVAREQSLFDLGDGAGTLVGMRGPAFARGLGVPGWHWHFLTADKARGGHVLAAGMGPEPSVGKVQALRRLELVLPGHGLTGLDLARDRSQELRAVEHAQ